MTPHLCPINPLHEASIDLLRSWWATISPARCLVVRSGWGINAAEHEQRPFWLAGPQPAWPRFADACEDLAGESARLALLPSGRDVVSDTPSLLSFLRSRPRWACLLAPDELTTPDMLPSRDDHAERYALVASTLHEQGQLLGLVMPCHLPRAPFERALTSMQPPTMVLNGPLEWPA